MLRPLTGARARAIVTLIVLLIGHGSASAQSSTPVNAADTTGPASLILDRIFNSDDFATQPLGRPRWLADGTGYTKLEARQGGDNTTIHLYSLLTRYLQEHLAGAGIAGDAKRSAP